MTDWKKALSAVESGSLSLDTELSSPRQQPSPSAFDLQDVPANNTGGQRFDLPLFDDELQKRRLDVSLGNAVDKNPQQASELSKLARSSGLPVETVEGQIKEVRKRTMLEEMGTKKIVQQTPTLADFLADPQNANQAHKDIKQLSTIEIVLRAHKRGGLINEEGRGYFATMFDDDESINTYLDGIEQSLSTTHADEGGFANEFLDPAAEIAGQMTNLYKNSADEALLGATAGGMYGTYLSAPTGGAIAPLTATAGAVAGAGVGLTSSAAREAFVIESGHAYKEFLSFKDDEGVGMDKGTAKNAALLVGAINASLEMLGVAVVTKPWVEAAKKMTRKQVMLSLKNPTMRRAITNFAKNYIVSGAGEVAVEVTQEIVTMAVGELAKKGSDAEFESMPLDEALSRAGEVAEKVTKGMMVLGLGGAGVNLTQDVKAARKGRTEAKKLTDVSKQVNASELKKNNPDAFKELMQRIGKETDSETVYLDADETKLLFQSSNIDPELFEIPAVQKMLGEMDQAIEEGRNIEVPIEEYAQDIMGTALEDLLLPYAKLSHDAMSMSEQQNKTVNEEVDRLAALNAEEFESQQVVYNDILGQRLGLGILRETAEKEALWYEATLRVLAKRVGKTPEEIWEKRKLRIQNEVDPHTARRIQAITGLDMLLNRLREGDVPKQKDIYGESLFQFIQSKGGISQKDEGGEVSGTDIDYGVIGKNRLVRPQGMSLDGMAELAAGEGFIPVDEHGKWNIQDLINAIGEEADGNPQYLDGNLNAEKQTAQQDLFSLEEALGQAGIDIQQTDNASIIEQFFSGTEGVVFQARTEGYQGNELSEASEWVRAVDKGLDMSEDARMARAHEQGYDIERKLYHGTSDDIASFDPEMLQQRDSGFIGLGVYLTSSPRIADFYANTAARYKANEDGGYSNSNILQLLAITEKTKTYNLADKGDMGVEAFNDRSFPKQLTDDLKKQGYDSAQVLDASDGIVEVVIFDPSNVRSVNAAFDPEFTDSADLLAQSNIDDLVVSHNLSEENLKHALDLGGIAAPSLAVQKASKGFDSFGEISLLANPEMINDKSIRFFDADIYSPRQQRATYDINLKKYNALADELSVNRSEVGEIRGIDISEMEHRGVDDLLRSWGLQYHWLKQQGIAPKTKKRKVDKWTKAGLKIADFKNNHVSQFALLENPKFISLAEKKYKAMGEEMGEPNAFFEDGKVTKGSLNSFAMSVVNFQRSHGVDEHAMRDAITKKMRVKKNQKEFKAYANEVFADLVDRERLFSGTDNQGRKKYKPYTLDNVVRDMIGSLQGGESFRYGGAGHVRSALAKKLSSVAAVKKSRDKIISSKEMESIKESADKVHGEFIEAVRPHYRFDSNSSHYVQDAEQTVMDYALGKDSLSSAFNMEGGEVQKLVDEHIAFLADLPTEYFEGKARRAMQLEEFHTAVIPKNASKETVASLKNAGLKIKRYDSKVEGARSKVVASQKELLFQSWYRSALKDTVAGIDKIAGKDGMIQPKQAKSWLASQQKKGAFKQEEIEWVGLNEWLDIQDGKVSVADIHAFVDGNGVQVEEVELSGADETQAREEFDETDFDEYGWQNYVWKNEQSLFWNLIEKKQSDFEGFDEFWYRYGGKDIAAMVDYDGEFLESIRSEGFADYETDTEASENTKYSEYQLEGGENYRELLLTLPFKNTPLSESEKSEMERLSKHLRSADYGESGLTEKQARFTELSKRDNGIKSIYSAAYKSTHWDEANVLAHIRMNDRVDSEGNKVLFIEEMQSDWSSDGRKNGFAVAARDTDGWSAELQPSGRYSVIDENGQWMSNYSASSPEDAVSLAAESRPDNRVSNAPFVKETKSYLALATKRIIAYAAENSYDKVAIINGEQSADRYDLSKQVDQVSYNKKAEMLRVIDKKGRVTTKRKSVEELPDFIGKELAEKISQSNDDIVSFDGLDLKVGGEGMKAFYDQIVPQVLKSVLKKTGGNKLEPVVMGDLSQTGFSITEQMKENVSNGLPLFQKDKGPRGYFNPETDTITLTPDADMSTFIHESAHFFFEIMRDLAKDDSGIAADLEAVDKWARSQGAVTDREIHEHFASGYEARLFEGKSPSTALQSLYFTFSKWIQNVYDSADDIFRANGMEGSKLSDEVREVYDRLIATDEEIEAARSQQNYGPMPMEQIGMSPEEAVAYQVMVNDAGDEARSNLENQVMRQMQRATKDWWKKGVAKRVQGVRAELDEQPEYRARDFLSGDRIPEGVTAVKLDGKYITDVYGKTVARKLNRMTSKDGVHPALVAPMFGYADSADIVEALMNTMTKAERKKYEQSQAQTMMREEHGDMLLDGSVAEEAQRAVHNEKQAELLLEEMKFLNRRAGNQQTPRQHFKAAAERSISAMPINQIRPDKHRRNEAKARSQAIKFAAKGEYKKAALEQHKALRQFYLAKVSADAVEESNAGYKYAKSLLSGSKYKTIQKAGDHYIDQIKAILEQVELRKVSNKQLTRRQSMKAWHKTTLDAAGIGNPELVSDLLEDAEKPIREQEMRDDTQTLGANFYVVDDLINSQKAKNYRELTVDEFSAVVQAMKHVEHMAKLKTKLLTDKDKREINEHIADLIAEIEEHSMGVKKNDTFGSIKTNKEVRGEKWRQYFDTSRTPTSLIRMLGGFKEGSDAWRILGQPLQDASALETDQLNIANMEIERIFGDHYSETELKLMNIKRYNRSVGKLFSKHDALSILLNWGSETNRLRVIDGFRIDEATAVSLMDTYLDERDYKFVNELVDFVGGFKKAAFELHEDMYGFTPEEVVPTPFASKYGQQKGWYWPIKYNPLKSSRAEQNSLTSIEQFDSRLSATKKLGSTESRAKRVFMEIETDMMTVLMGHTADVIHKTTHQRALYDIGRVLSDNKVKQSIQDAHGDHVYKQITSMVRNVKEGAEQTRNFNDWIFQHARNNVTIAMLGASVTTSSIQMFGATNSFVKARFLGASLSKGYVKYGKNMPETIKVIREKSLYMKNREQVMSVAIARIKNKLRKRGRLDKIKEMSMIPIMKVQFLTVDAPLWIAIYDHNIENGISEKDSIDRADQAVRDAQGGGDIVDTAEGMQGGAAMRLFTNFLSYMVSTYTLQSEAFHRLKVGEDNFFDFAVNSFVLMLMPSMVMAVFRDWIAGEDDDETLWKRFIKETGSFWLSTNVISAQFSGIASGFDYSGPQGTAIVGKVGQLSKQAVQGEADEALFKAMIWVGGLTLGLPAAQANRSLFGAIDAIEKDKPPSKFVKQAFFGKER